MRSINRWNDREPFCSVPLTGKASRLSYRLLCDVTAQGKKVPEKCFGTPNLILPESWNRGSNG